MQQPTPNGSSTEHNNWLKDQLAKYPLLQALQGRRSRRFGMGMKIEQGPFTYASPYPPQPLTEDEEAILAFAACGITGYALADLAYGKGQGGHMLDGLVGRTVASPDAINTVSVAITNDDATYILKRPQDFAFSEIPDLIRLSEQGQLTELYRRMRVKIGDSRATVPVEPGFNFNINKWSVYAKGGTYFVPINEMTAMYINALLESFEPEMGLFVIDERNLYQPAGIGRFAKSKGGPLNDDLKSNQVVTVQGLEMSFAEACAVEQGMVLQNLGLMSQLIGLGGFSNFARSEFGWFESLGFRMEKMLSTKYAGANGLMTAIFSLLGRNFMYPYAVGLERDGKVLLHAYCPPYYSSMKDAVLDFVAHKFGPQGIYREGAYSSAWKDPAVTSQGIDGPSETAVQATIAYCDYIFKRYGRFPAYSAPFRTVIGYQATYVDVDFYRKFYRAEALTETQYARQDFLNPTK